jgi:hypothetical protein
MRGKRKTMSQHNHQTAPTQFVEANGIRFAYRRFGRGTGVPLVFNQHFTGTMDHWDPAVTDGFAGIAKSSCSTTPEYPVPPERCPPGSIKWAPTR